MCQTAFYLYSKQAGAVYIRSHGNFETSLLSAYLCSFESKFYASTPKGFDCAFIDQSDGQLFLLYMDNIKKYNEIKLHSDPQHNAKRGRELYTEAN